MHKRENTTGQKKKKGYSEDRVTSGGNTALKMEIIGWKAALKEGHKSITVTRYNSFNHLS